MQSEMRAHVVPFLDYIYFFKVEKFLKVHHAKNSRSMDNFQNF